MAAHWMEDHNSTLDDVFTFHALVDIEGPSDSFEQCGAASAFVDRFGSPGTDYPGWVGQTMEYVDWFDWLLSTSALVAGYWLRPPRESVFLDGYPLDMCEEGSTWVKALEIRRGWSAAWQEVCVYHGGETATGAAVPPDLDPFYDDREPILVLPDLVAAGIGYIRIQGLTDHGQPGEFENRHAVKALNAAYDAAHPNAYYVDADHLLTEPVRYDGTFNDTDPDGVTTGTSEWPTWAEFGGMRATPVPTTDADGYDATVFIHHVRAHAIRWAFDQVFA